jgi:hypothetical protein
MRLLGRPLCGIGLAAAIFIAGPALAQSDATSSTAPAVEAIDPASIPMPDLSFQPTPEDISNYDKYFYFHRADTDFASAYADLQECDGYARGLAFRAGGGPVPYPYAGTLGGAIGGAIGSAMADAIFGSAERRKQRRMNMRTCMTYKGYQTFGLRKSLWEEFNFEEGLNAVDEPRRQRLLRIQARVASGPRPQVGEMVE